MWECSGRHLALEHDLLSGQLLSQTLLSHIWLCPAREPVGAQQRCCIFCAASLPWHSTAFFSPRLYIRKYLDGIILKINICSSSGLFLFRHWKILEKMCCSCSVWSLWGFSLEQDVVGCRSTTDCACGTIAWCWSSQHIPPLSNVPYTASYLARGQPSSWNCLKNEALK